jgi:methylisocitrate lyase
MTTPTAQTQSAPKPADSPADRLRLMMRERVVGMPGAFNGLAARLVKDAGFDGAYVSGAAVTASFGVPDVGMLTLNEFCNVIYQVARATGYGAAGAMPIIADADTGFGEEEMVRRVVHEYHRAGAAGFHIEDQVFPKRCGHLDGKTLVSVEHFSEKVAAAAAARDALGGNAANGSGGRGPFIVCARTDAAGVSGVDDTIARGKAYVDAGADMIFPEGLRSEDEFARVADALRAHSDGVFLLANMTEFGKTPITPLARFGELGYHAVIWPVSTLRSAMGEVKRLLAGLREDGTVEGGLDRMLTRTELYEALGYTPGEAWAFGG